MKNLKLELHFAATAALCLAGAASADVVAWENCNLVIPNNIDGLYINVETRATGSAGSVVAGWDINPYSATSLTWFNATGTGMMRFPGVTTGSAGNLADGTVVGPTGSYGSGAVTVGSNPGNWVLNSVNKFGFRFVAADGQTHYGWGTFQIGSSISGADRTITNLYYETLPATSITVGSGGGPPPAYDPCAATNPTVANGANTKSYRDDAADLVTSCGTIYGANYYKFTPIDSGSYTFESCVAGAGVQMAVFSGCDSFATELACGSPACGGLGSSATVTLTAGVPVYVVSGGSSSFSGLTNSMSVSIVAPPVGACVSAVDAVFGANAFANTGSGPQSVKASFNGVTTAVVQKAVWYKFVAGATGAYSIGLCGATGDTMLAIGTICPGAGSRFEAIAYNDDAPCTGGAGTLRSFIDATNGGATGTYAGFPLAEDLVAGQTYYILAGSYSATAAITGDLIIDGPPQTPPCDGDFNGDGARDGADLGVLLAAFGVDAGGDMNGDGITDGADLGAFLAVFGTPCQ